MNSRDRMEIAMNCRKADRIPVMCQLALGHYFLNTDIDSEKIWFTSEGFAAALLQLQKRYRFDGILVNLWGMPENILEGVVSVEEHRDEKILHWNNGEITVIPSDDNAQHFLKKRGPSGQSRS